MRLWQMAFLAVVGLSALAASGCTSYHVGEALGRDLGEFGAAVSNHYAEKQDRLDHGSQHPQHYRSRIKTWLVGQ